MLASLPEPGGWSGKKNTHHRADHPVLGSTPKTGGAWEEKITPTCSERRQGPSRRCRLHHRAVKPVLASTPKTGIGKHRTSLPEPGGWRWSLVKLSRKKNPHHRADHPVLGSFPKSGGAGEEKITPTCSERRQGPSRRCRLYHRAVKPVLASIPQTGRGKHPTLVENITKNTGASTVNANWRA